MFSSLFDIWLIVLQLNGPLVFFGKRKDVEACRESHILVWHIHDLWRSSVRWFLNLTFKFSWICLIAYEKTKQNIQIISIFISVWVKYNLNSMNTLHLQYKQPQSCCWLHSYPDVFFSSSIKTWTEYWKGKGAQATGMTAVLRRSSRKVYSRTDWGWCHCIKSHDTQTHL